MIMRRLATAGLLCLLGTWLFAQAPAGAKKPSAAKGKRPAAKQAIKSRFRIDAVQTQATRNDWEEINFEFNSAIISDGFPTLLWLADFLKSHPEYRVRIVGHTDYVGSSPYNQALGEARAESVAAFLKKYGAAANQVTTASEGKSRPEAANTTKEGRFVNRRVNLTVTDGQGRQMSLEDLIRRVVEQPKAKDCCDDILKRLDKLDDILAELRRLKGEHDNLQAKLNDLQNQISGLPKPVTEPQAREIVKAEGETIATNAATRAAEEAARRNKKFSLLGVNIGPTFGRGRTGDYTISGRGQFFSPFGGSGMHAVQAQGEYMYYTGRQEAQFDIGLVNRWKQMQAGGFASFRYVNFREFQNGGTLGQAAFTLDYLFGRGRVGLFGTKGFKNTAVLNRAQLGPGSFLETYARIMNQAGVSALVGTWGDAYLEGNMAYLQSHGRADRPGGMLRMVQPITDQLAFTTEVGWNESLVNTRQSGRLVVGLQFGNFVRPKDYLSVTHPVPVDIPRIRYELLTRRVGNSPPVADAGPDQIGVQPGTVTLNGSGSYDPDGDPLTFQWTQIAGPAVSISGANTAVATFTAADGQSYSFRLTVKDPGGLTATARTTVTTTRIPEVRIIEFSATPNEIQPGQQVILRWNVEGADTVSIEPGIGNVRPAGTATVNPMQTTEYRLTARGPGGREGRASITVRVLPPLASNPRILRFEATPTNIVAGESSTLAWATEEAVRVSISGIGEVPVNGSRVVSPTQTTTYVLTARGADGREVTAPVVVTVTSGNLPRILQFSGTPTSVDPGGAVQLCWNVENATEITITPGVGGGLKPVDCTTVRPNITTTYTLTARNATGLITAAVLITVGQVKITSFVNEPEFSQQSGAPVTLRWTTENATHVVITGLGAPTGNQPPNGSVVVRPTTNTSYTLTAFGAGGSTNAVLHVFVR